MIGSGCIQNIERNPANPLEIGWRLRPEKWGKGYASEAAREMTRFAFETLDAQLLCAVCHQENARFRRRHEAPRHVVHQHRALV